MDSFAMEVVLLLFAIPKMVIYNALLLWLVPSVIYQISWVVWIVKMVWYAMANTSLAVLKTISTPMVVHAFSAQKDNNAMEVK